MTIYTAMINGEGGEADEEGDLVEAIEADNDADALDLAIQWVLTEYWSDQGCVVCLTLHRDRILTENCPSCGAKVGVRCTGEEPCVLQTDTEEISVEPDPSVIDHYHNRHKRLGHEHTWEVPLKMVGGSKENPGVVVLGQGKTELRSMCACGAQKTEISVEKRNPNDPNSNIKITYPEGLWPWGERCEFPGEKKNGDKAPTSKVIRRTRKV